MELASQIFLSLKFEIEKLLDPFPNILYPLLVKIGWTASSFFGLILIFLQEWRIEKKISHVSFIPRNILSDNIEYNWI